VGGQCGECKVDIVNSDERRKRFAKIVIPIPVVNPVFYDLVTDIAGKTFKKAIDDLMRNDKSVLYMTDDEFVVTLNPESIPEGAQKWERAEAIYELVKGVAEDAIEDGVEEWQLVMENIDNLLIDQIIVLPPDLRPSDINKERSDGEHYY